MLLSHPVGIVTSMRISTLFSRTKPTASAGPARCGEGLAHCHGTLVLHADGTVECDGESICGADEVQHELWVACDELGCSCAGDDAPLEGWATATSILLAA
jgi:hypothetical protein